MASVFEGIRQGLVMRNHAPVDRNLLGRAVAVANGKGGIGKTTATVGGLAAAAGHRVLLLDLDPQGNLGDDLGYNITGDTDSGHQLLMSLMGWHSVGASSDRGTAEPGPRLWRRTSG